MIVKPLDYFLKFFTILFFQIVKGLDVALKSLLSIEHDDLVIKKTLVDKPKYPENFEITHR